MSDHGSGLQPLGGLRPLGGGVAGGVAPAGAPPSTGTTGLRGLTGLGGPGATPGAPTAAPPGSPPPSTMPPPPYRPASAPVGNPPARPVSGLTAGAPGVTPTPPRAATAPAWEEPSSRSPGRIWAIVGGVVAAALLFCAYFVFRAPPMAFPPTGYAPFTSGDKKWGFDAPQGWSESSSGAASEDTKSVGMNGVTYTSGSATLDISISTVAGLMQKQLLFGSDPVPEAMAGSRANGVQDDARRGFKKQFKNYHEAPITENLPTAMGGITLAGFKVKPDVRMAEFSASSSRWGLGGPVHGYRASLAGRTLIAYVICRCSERDWPAIKPSFLRMLATVHENRMPGDRIDTTPGIHTGTGPGNLLAPIGGM